MPAGSSQVDKKAERSPIPAGVVLPGATGVLGVIGAVGAGIGVGLGRGLPALGTEGAAKGPRSKTWEIIQASLLKATRE